MILLLGISRFQLDFIAGILADLLMADLVKLLLVELLELLNCSLLELFVHGRSVGLLDLFMADLFMAGYFSLLNCLNLAERFMVDLCFQLSVGIICSWQISSLYFTVAMNFLCCIAFVIFPCYIPLLYCLDLFVSTFNSHAILMFIAFIMFLCYFALAFFMLNMFMPSFLFVLIAII